jgi:hypothetical protein
LGAVDFSKWAYGTLKEDEKYQKYVDRLITPSKSTIRKSDALTVSGMILSHVVGLGWQSRLRAAITFKDHPIELMTIMDHKEAGKPKIRFYFSTRGLATDKDVKQMEIKPMKKGFISEKIVGVTLALECIGRKEIEHDKELLKNLYQLFKTQRLYNIDDLTETPMTVEIIRKDEAFIGKIEVGIEDITKDGLTLLFECATKMAEDVLLALESSRTMAD